MKISIIYKYRLRVKILTLAQNIYTRENILKSQVKITIKNILYRKLFKLKLEIDLLLLE